MQGGGECFPFSVETKVGGIRIPVSDNAGQRLERRE